jgi:hypothetical protein
VRKMLFCVATLSALAGCAANKPNAGLNQYIRDLDYQPFALPRSQDGVGTIIDFKNGTESLVATGDECFLKMNGSTVNKRKVGTTDVERTIDLGADMSFSLPRSLLSFADISGLAKASKAKSIKVSLKQPFEQYISRLQFRSYVNGLSSTDPCKPLLTDAQNLIISQTLGAESVSYQFLDSSDNAISLTADIVNGANLKPELRSKIQNTNKLETAEPLLIGYRTWDVTKPSGVIGTELDVREVPRQELEARRENSR